MAAGAFEGGAGRAFVATGTGGFFHFGVTPPLDPCQTNSVTTPVAMITGGSAMRTSQPQPARDLLEGSGMAPDEAQRAARPFAPARTSARAARSKASASASVPTVMRR